MRPDQGHRRISRSTETKITRGHVRCVPALLVDQANTLGEVLQRAQIGSRVTAGIDFIGVKFMPGARSLIGQKQCASIWVFIGALMDISGVDANVVTAYSGYQSSLCRHSPAFDVRFEKISVVANELGCTMVAPIGKELSRTDQCRYMHRQG